MLTLNLPVEPYWLDLPREDAAWAEQAGEGFVRAGSTAGRARQVLREASSRSAGHQANYTPGWLRHPAAHSRSAACAFSSSAGSTSSACRTVPGA